MPKKELNLRIETEVLTFGAAAEVVNGIFEFLLFRRNQIPFVYPTYRYYVGLWSECKHDMAEESNDLRMYHLERQRELAKATKDKISDLRELIRNCFKNEYVKTIRFLFGSTAFTPKESYTIHIPVDAINKEHFYDHHPLTKAKLNLTLLGILSCEESLGLFSKEMHATNVFLQVETIPNFDRSPEDLVERHLVAKDLPNIPSSCLDVQIHLEHFLPAEYDNKTLSCCKELKVFEDLLTTKVKLEEKNHTDKQKYNETSWWEARTIVQGFKEKQIKGKSIWTVDT